MMPSNYRPRDASGFIGPAKAHALQIEKLVALARQSNSPLAILIIGKPGIGKSELAEHAGRCLATSKFSTVKLNGTQVKIEEVESLARSLAFRDLFGDYRFIRIEEVDKVPAVAQVRLLTLLDDMPAKTAFVCTSNCKKEDLEIRFQTRFTVIEVASPSCSDIAGLLETFGSLPANAVTRIATFACGCVRQALREADSALCQ